MKEEVKAILDAAGEDPCKIFAGMSGAVSEILKTKSPSLVVADEDKPGRDDDFVVILAKMKKTYMAHKAKMEETVTTNKKLLDLLENMILAYEEWKKNHSEKFEEIRDDLLKWKSYVEAQHMYHEAIEMYRIVKIVQSQCEETLYYSSNFLLKLGKEEGNNESQTDV